MPNRTTQVLEQFVAATTGPMTVVAPYITRQAMVRLLDLIGIRPLRVYTDWNARAVRSGSTDPRVYGDIVTRKNGSRVLLHSQLHAKLYYTSEGCLVGSANVTARGLGWHVTPNLELLVPVPADHPEVTALLDDLRDQTRLASWDDVDHALLAAKVPAPVPVDESEPVAHLHVPVGQALTALEAGVSPSSVVADLAALGLPDNLDAESTIVLARRTVRATAHYALADKLRRDNGSRHDQVQFVLHNSHFFGLKEPESVEEASQVLDVLAGWMTAILPRTFHEASEGSRLATAPILMGRFA